MTNKLQHREQRPQSRKHESDNVSNHNAHIYSSMMLLAQRCKPTGTQPRPMVPPKRQEHEHATIRESIETYYRWCLHSRQTLPSYKRAYNQLKSTSLHYKVMSVPRATRPNADNANGSASNTDRNAETLNGSVEEASLSKETTANAAEKTVEETKVTESLLGGGVVGAVGVLHGVAALDGCGRKSVRGI